ncbi:hypothetical protein [Pseudoxanthomonas sp.]|jgi:hypothetical protein|uniref:hypothetical protein n=1 Tax=Pseudoxanthomonas sp. TaxID=1871049 RepID=UPI002E0EC6AA|nr:hypothetical protein [Pseudoxanthomonas sp.]
MTEAVLAWQALIFASIGLTGRWRGWVIAFWVVWTIIQVVALPLSLLQFGTIAAAAALFGSKHPAKQSPPAESKPQLKPPVAATPSASSAATNKSSLAKFASTADAWARKADAWSAEIQRKSAERLQEQHFRLEAEQQIKTEGFSCALEERVMREAFARDQQLTHEVQTELAKDAVLAKLYRAALGERERLPKGVGERQLTERYALEAARTERGTLDKIIDEGPDYRRHYFESRKLLSALDAESSDGEAHLMLYGRHLNDWLAEVEALRGSPKAPRHSAAISAEALFGRLAAPQSVAALSLGSSKAPMALVREKEPGEPTAYVTRNTFKRVGKSLRPAELSIDVVFAYIYKNSLRALLNDTEARRLYVLRCLLQGKTGQLTTSEKTFSPGYVFSISPSKFHAAPTCEYLKADFINYLVPPEIKVQGPERVREFQQFCEDNKHLLKDKTPEAFWAHVGTRFRISSHPRHVQYANSGVQELARGMGAAELQAQIESAVAEAESMIVAGTGGGIVANLRYSPNPKRTLESIGDRRTRELVQKFFDLKRNVLDFLFEFYSRESDREDLALPVPLLESSGLTPCRRCWNAGATSQTAATHPHSR